MQSKLTRAMVMGLGLLVAGQATAATTDKQGDAELSGIVASADSAIAIGATTVSSTTAAQDSSVEESSGWQFAVTPYIWASGISADINIGDVGSVEMDTGFTEILSNLKFTFMGAFEARKGRFVMLTDIIYLHVGSEEDGPAGFVEADVDLKTFLGTAMAGYRVVDEGPMFLDLFAGGRLTSMDVGLDLTGPQQSAEQDESKTAISPVVGTRFRAPLGERWGVGIYGDLAGFGITSDLTWQLFGTIQYDISDRWRVGAGYRHVAVDFDPKAIDIDMRMSGPIIGFSYRF